MFQKYMNKQLILSELATIFDLNKTSLEKLITLLDQGLPVPFITNYRKEATNGLEEDTIYHIKDEYQYFIELENQKEAILKEIEQLGKLTPELTNQIEACKDKIELADYYFPFKPRGETAAIRAKEQGLEPLAQIITSQETDEQPLEEIAANYLNHEKGVENVQEALAGASSIIVEWILEDFETRYFVRDYIFKRGVIESSAAPGKEKVVSKFQDYYNFSESVARIPSHRILALQRGEKEGFIKVNLKIKRGAIIEFLRRNFLKEKKSSSTPFLRELFENAYDSHLISSLERVIWDILKERAYIEAIDVFKMNLRNLLMTPPTGHIPVIAIDPGYRTGCKIAAIDPNSQFMEFTTIYPHKPYRKVEEARKMLRFYVKKHKAEAVAIGNGTASRETDEFVRQTIEDIRKPPVQSVIVDESGARVYSTSKIAKEEFPDLDPTVRSAISIGRRLQDPLAELVKIEPRSIGVGQYQHDVDQKALKKSLQEVVESCVNHVGVDLNNATYSLLNYVSGLNSRVTKEIIKYRERHGKFNTRAELLSVSGIGPKTYELCAGFLRVKDGSNPLDVTKIHPLHYPIVEAMAKSRNCSVDELISDPEKVNAIELSKFLSENLGLLTLENIIAELKEPGKDPRTKLQTVEFRGDVKDIKDLELGMMLNGKVTNVTNFGVFVDIGVHQDGLIHISELSHTYIKDPASVVAVGDVVKVKILSVDKKRKRIGLSIKAAVEVPEMPKKKKKKKKKKRMKQVSEVTPESSLQKRLEELQKYFKDQKLT